LVAQASRLCERERRAEHPLGAFHPLRLSQQLINDCQHKKPGGLMRCPQKRDPFYEKVGVGREKNLLATPIYETFAEVPTWYLGSKDKILAWAEE
jgi:hypothetical protein